MAGGERKVVQYGGRGWAFDRSQEALVEVMDSALLQFAASRPHASMHPTACTHASISMHPTACILHASDSMHDCKAKHHANTRGR